MWCFGKILLLAKLLLILVYYRSSGILDELKDIENKHKNVLTDSNHANLHEEKYVPIKNHEKNNGAYKIEKNMKEKATTAPIENEADNGLKNKAYTLAMARTSDPHSASAQFFINLVDNDFLDHSSKTMSGWGYAVFGKVIKGMEVVDKISEVATATKGFHDDVPVKPITIKKATILKQ